MSRKGRIRSAAVSDLPEPTDLRDWQADQSTI
jgi:hypothetical protein